MKSLPRFHGNLALSLAICLILFSAFFRILGLVALPNLPNFAPVMAIALCGALVLPGWLALAVPLTALIVSDVLLDLHYGVAPTGFDELIRYACYGFGVAAGLALRRLRADLPLTVAAVVANTLLFYFVTNTACWFTEPAYAKTVTGWLQALTTGIPGYPPTWTFLCNSLVGDLLFTTGFLAAMHLASRKTEAVPAKV